MKKLFSIITTIALALTLTACGKSQKSSDPSKPSELYSGGRGFYYDGTSEGLQSLYEQALAELPDEIPLPDGTSVSKNEAAGFSLEMNAAYFDFAFIRYAEPIFNVTSNEPVELSKIESPNWIKVKAGDVLENGLKVVSAQTPCHAANGAAELSCGEIKLEGEITLEGIFEYSGGSAAYGYGDYFYSFFPDSTKHKIPVMYENSEECVQTQSAFIAADKRLVYDGMDFYSFRFEDELLKDKFSEDTVSDARITYKNIVIRDRQLSGEIVDADFTPIPQSYWRADEPSEK